MRSGRRVAIIGGSGAQQLPGFEARAVERCVTPWGEPSAPVHIGELCGLPALFLARHGEPHAIAPHRINYRANLRALADMGATHVVALNTVGGIAAAASPGSLWLPGQIVDYTWGREGSFCDGVLLPLDHVELADPFDAALRGTLVTAAAAADICLHDGGVYGCTQGPRLETAAEIRRLQRDGCDLVGMTGMPETALARELALPYAMLAMVVNRAAGLAEEAISLEQIRREAEGCLRQAGVLLARFAADFA